MAGMLSQADGPFEPGHATTFVPSAGEHRHPDCLAPPAADAAAGPRAGAAGRYAARQAHERAAVTADRHQRSVIELPDRLDRMAELTSAPPGPGG